MQRTVFNVWGREVRSPDIANSRLVKAQADNPKVTNLHIQIRVQEPSKFDVRRIIFYRPAWYDRKVANKEAAKRRGEPKRVPHECCGCVL